MEFLIPTSPTAIIIAILLVAFVAVRIVSDFRGVRQSRQLYETLLKIGKLHSQQSFTVLIELSRKAETIFSLLDSIYAQDYPSVQVIVAIKAPAGAAAKAKLAAYKRQHKLTHFKTVNYTKGQTALRLLKRYTTGKIVITLTTGEKLSPDFFNDLSLDFLNPNVIAIVPDNVHQLDTTVSTALHEHFLSIIKMKKVLNLNKAEGLSPLTNGIAFRFGKVSKDTDVATLVTSTGSRSAFITSSSNTLKLGALLKKSVNVTKTLLNNQYLLWGSLTPFLAAIILLIIFPTETILLIGTLVILYTVLYGSVVFQNKAYGLSNRISLLLLAPFAVIYAILIYISTVLYIGWRTVVKSFQRFLLVIERS